MSQAYAIAQVVDIRELRARQRLASYESKMTAVLGSNRRSIGRLYETGALFTRAGAQVGRNLLLAHQHLLRVVTLLNRLSDKGDIPAPLAPDTVEAVYRELDVLLDRTDALTRRTGKTLARLCPE